MTWDEINLKDEIGLKKNVISTIIWKMVQSKFNKNGMFHRVDRNKEYKSSIW